jgi:hypothetical protein
MSNKVKLIAFILKNFYFDKFFFIISIILVIIEIKDNPLPNLQNFLICLDKKIKNNRKKDKYLIVRKKDLKINKKKRTKTVYFE